MSEQVYMKFEFKKSFTGISYVNTLSGFLNYKAMEYILYSKSRTN